MTLEHRARREGVKGEMVRRMVAVAMSCVAAFLLLGAGQALRRLGDHF